MVLVVLRACMRLQGGVMVRTWDEVLALGWFLLSAFALGVASAVLVMSSAGRPVVRCYLDTLTPRYEDGHGMTWRGACDDGTLVDLAEHD